MGGGVIPDRGALCESGHGSLLTVCRSKPDRTVGPTAGWSESDPNKWCAHVSAPVGGSADFLSDDRRCSTAIPATNLRRMLLVKIGCVAARFHREHRTRNMTICRSLPTDFCLRRAVRAQVSGDRQTSPVRVSWGRPAHGRKYLIARMFAALKPARWRFLPCFSGENRGRRVRWCPCSPRA
jgi:hypothetical protein